MKKLIKIFRVNISGEILHKFLDFKKENVMEFIYFIVLGAIAGWAAGKIFKGEGFGLIGNIIVGVVGALLGGWVLGLVGLNFGGLIGSLATAIIGALLLLWIVSLIKK